MPQIINTNIASLNAQRNLNGSQNSLATTLQRLSSGLRINSAKDDAAGLAISERFTTQIRGLNQAVRNANDGISLAQTGEGALGEITSNLQRIRELAVQAANASNSPGDRAALNLEVQQRLAEIDRTAATTTFNGQKILDGTFGSATFQVGANAGETIGINLNSSVRSSAVGAIASATSGALGASAVDGSVTVTPGTLNFGTGASAATSGTRDLNVSTLNFGTAGVALVNGTSQTFNPTTLNFGTAASAATAKVTTSAAFTAGDYTASGPAAHFEFTDDTVTGLVVAVDGTNYTGNEAQLVTDIQAQLTAAGSNTVVSFAGGSLVFTSGETGSAATQPSIANVGADLDGDGFNTFVNTGGADAVATTNASFTVNDTGANAAVVVTLDQDYGTDANLLADLNAQLNASGYTATVDGSGNFTITNNNTTAVDISAADAVAVAAGIGNSSGNVGTGAVTTTNATFTVDSTSVTLDQDYASYAALATDLATKLGVNYTVTATGGTNVQIATAATGNTATAPAISAIGAGQAGTNATNAGLGVGAGTGVNGQNAVATTNASFQVDGQAVTLDQNYANLAALAADLDSQLSTEYSVIVDGSDLRIEHDGSASAVNITGADANATATGFDNATGDAGVSAGSITLASGDFTIANGSNTSVDLAGTYANAQALADAINLSVSGVYATISGGALNLTSAEAITLGGAEATGTLGFSGTSFTAVNGSLVDVNVSSVSGANDALQRVDAALKNVSDLRSTFGAIQNRFDSVITSLSATAENLTASRSRILDADFAAETANLTRAQILQQAGTAILAQANALPQSVLSLLR